MQKLRSSLLAHNGRFLNVASLNQRAPTILPSLYRQPSALSNDIKFDGSYCFYHRGLQRQCQKKQKKFFPGKALQDKSDSGGVVPTILKNVVLKPLVLVGKAVGLVVVAAASALLHVVLVGGLWVFTRRLGKAMSQVEQKVHVTMLEKHRRDPAFITYMTNKILERNTMVSTVLNEPENYMIDNSRESTESTTFVLNGFTRHRVTVRHPLICHYNAGTSQRTYLVKAAADLLDDGYHMYSMDIAMINDPSSVVVSLSKEELAEDWEAIMQEMAQKAEADEQAASAGKLAKATSFLGDLFGRKEETTTPRQGPDAKDQDRKKRGKGDDGSIIDAEFTEKKE